MIRVHVHVLALALAHAQIPLCRDPDQYQDPNLIRTQRNQDQNPLQSPIPVNLQNASDLDRDLDQGLGLFPSLIRMIQGEEVLVLVGKSADFQVPPGPIRGQDQMRIIKMKLITIIKIRNFKQKFTF